MAHDRWARTARIIAIACALSTALPAAAAAQHDFSGVRLFWRIADQLRLDREPSAAAWDSLFATPGYAALQARERRRAALTEGFRLALMPSRAHERDSVMALRNWTSRVVQHISSVMPRRERLERFARQLEDRDVLTDAIARSQSLLPPSTTQRLVPPAVAFIFFLPDGRGYPELIVADLANVMQKSNPIEFFAHEVTHYYYARLAEEHRSSSPAPATPAEQALLVLLAKLHEESLGDQHDKIPWLTTERAATGADPAWLAYMGEYAVHYRDGATATGELLADLDAALADATSVVERIQEIGRTLPLEGRPVGSWMTSAIRRTLGDARLGATAGDPASWIAAYAEAARHPQCGCPTVPETLLKFVPARH